jgi:Copper amine oxidase, enzyme domain
MATVGNYEYAFRWYLSLDGSIEMEIQLHGIVSTMALSNGAAPLGSNVVDRGLAAPHHQHLFCFRLDLDVDGRDNHVHEVESERVAFGDDNPLGNAFRPRVTPLRSERDARREASEATARVWTASSAQRRNVHGRPTAYRLVPGHGTATLLAQPGSSVDRRAGFARHTLWVTPYEAAERHPAGAYPLPARRLRRPAVLERRPRPRRPRRRVLVHGRRHALRAARGLADHVDDQGRLLVAAGRLPRPQPDARHPRAGAPLRRGAGRRLTPLYRRFRSVGAETAMVGAGAGGKGTLLSGERRGATWPRPASSTTPGPAGSTAS